jgi:hypothetical protein
MPKNSLLLLILGTTLKQTGEYLHSIAKFHKQMQPFISWSVTGIYRQFSGSFSPCRNHCAMRGKMGLKVWSDQTLIPIASRMMAAATSSLWTKMKVTGNHMWRSHSGWDQWHSTLPSVLLIFYINFLKFLLLSLFVLKGEEKIYNPNWKQIYSVCSNSFIYPVSCVFLAQRWFLWKSASTR